MSSSKLHLTLSCAALAISLALAIDWIIGPWFDASSQAVRWCLLAMTLALTATPLVYAINLARARHKEILDELKRLGQCSPREIAVRPVTDFAPTEPDAWSTAVDRVRERMASMWQRLEDLERQRTAIDNRARRHETQIERVNSILAGLPEPVIAINKYEELVLSNASAQELFSLNGKTTERRALRSLIRCERLVDLLTETRQRSAPVQRSCEIQVPDGKGGNGQWYRVVARGIPAHPGPTDGDCGPQGVVAVLHEISSEKAVEKRNAEFVSAVSHQMKTPLAGIKAYVELLADGEAGDPKTQEEFLDIINNQANRLQGLVENMLSLARIEAGVVAVNKQCRSLNEVLNEALEAVAPLVQAKGVTLHSDLSRLDPTALIDGEMMRQAVINLLSNAIKYTIHGGQVNVRSRLVDGVVQVDVEDNGVGISSDDCQKVFEKFYKPQNDKEMAGGTGLGLPLVKHIVEDVHGGKIQVRSTPGQGTVFSILLPRAANS